MFSSERACPFCSAPRASSGAVVALVAAAVLAGGAAHADPPSPRMGMPFMGAQGYGAPPDRPWERMGPAVAPTPPAVEAPAVQAGVTVARGPMRAIAPRVQRALVQRVATFGWCAGPLRGAARVSVLAEIGGDGALHVGRVAGATGAVRACVTERLEGIRVGGAGVAAGPVRFEVQLRAAGASTRSAAPPAQEAPSRCGASPAGCARGGCGEGLVCDRSVRCVPSSRGCDPQTGQWTCTSDCGGGVCVPPGARGLLR